MKLVIIYYYNNIFSGSLSKEDSFNQIEFIAVEEDKIIKQEELENDLVFETQQIYEEEIQDPLNSGLERALKENCGKYMCPSSLCGKFFTTSKKLKEHISNDHNQTEANETATEEDIQNEEHSDAQTGTELVNSPKIIKKSFICAICEKVCSNKPNLLRHVEKVHEKSGQVFFCPKCPKYFGYKQVRDRHIAANACHSRRNKNPQNLNINARNYAEQRNWYYGSKIRENYPIAPNFTQDIEKQLTSYPKQKILYKIKPKTAAITNDSLKHKCEECGAIFSNQSILIQHYSLIHPDFEHSVKEGQKIITSSYIHSDPS